MSGPTTRKPDRAVVQRIVTEEASRAGAQFKDVIGASNRVAAKSARTRAVARIMAETGCSHRGLENVWGSHLRKLARRAASPTMDETTAERLRWRYGLTRAQQIVAGRDPNTINDLAAWRRLCARGG